MMTIGRFAGLSPLDAIVALSVAQAELSPHGVARKP